MGRTRNEQGVAWSCCCRWPSFELLFIMCVCCPLQFWSRCVCGLPLQAGNLFILTWGLHCPVQCFLALCSRHLWKGDIICRWYCYVAISCSPNPLPPWQKCVQLSVNTPTEDFLRTSQRSKLQFHPFRLFILRTRGGGLVHYFQLPSWLYACTHCKEILCIWMYFKAVGRITKEYEDHELNGPLYVFRAEPPITTKEIPV